MVRATLIGALGIAAVGCLSGSETSGSSHPGTQLVAERAIGRPSILSAGGIPTVVFETPAPGAARCPPYAPADLGAVPFAGGERRLLVAGASPCWSQVYSGGRLYAMHGERASSAATSAGQPLEVASLARVDLAGGAADEVEDVAAFDVGGAGAFAYRSVPDGAQLPELHLRTAGETDIPLGAATGFERFVHGRLYYVSGNAYTLYRLAPGGGGYGGAPEPLAAGARSFWVRGDERAAVVVLGATSADKLVALDLSAGTQRALPGEGICCLLGFSSDEARYFYAEARAAPGSGILHVHTFATPDAPERDEAIAPPGDGGDEIHQVWERPGSDLLLLADAGGRLSVWTPGSAAARSIGRTAVAPMFVRNGRFLVFIERVSDGGEEENRILAMSADALGPGAPAETLTPTGTSSDGFFVFGGAQDLGFWAHFGGAAPDLYLADLESGTARVVARAVGPLAIGPDSIVGVVRTELQDLTGDLVRIDSASGAERVIAGAVNDFALARACDTCDPFAPGALLAYVVHTRVPSSADGLWGTVLP